MDTEKCDDSRGKLSQIVAARDDHRRGSEQMYAHNSHERLKRNIETKIRTTMIGSLSEIEQRFGHLWGQGKPRHLLTDPEREMEQIKDDLRTAILNLGNNQIRAAVAELAQYGVVWNRYQYSIDATKDDPSGDVMKVVWAE